MSRKSNDTPSSIRIRENQRRSRLRRAELLHSLQKRVQEYERQGVAATLEMQRAARKVVQDNVRLRALLALHGVSSEQVDSFLRSSDEPSSAQANPLSFHRPTTTHQRQAPEKEGNGSFSAAEPSHRAQSWYVSHEHTRVDSRRVLDTAENHSAQHSDAPRSSASIVQTEIPPPSESVADRDAMQGHRESNDGKFPCPVTEPSDCPTSLDCFCASLPVSEYHPDSSGLEISCEAAAAVLAEMRGDGDRDSIRAALGCRGQETCAVKNSTVLQMMDEG